MLALYEQVVATLDAAPPWPPPILVAKVHMEIPGLRCKRRMSHCEQLQMSQAVIWGDLESHTLAYTDGSMGQQAGFGHSSNCAGGGQQAVPAALGRIIRHTQADGRRPWSGPSTGAGANHERCALLYDFRMALLQIWEGDPCSPFKRALRAKAARLAEQGAHL